MFNWVLHAPLQTDTFVNMFNEVWNQIKDEVNKVEPPCINFIKNRSLCD